MEGRIAILANFDSAHEWMHFCCQQTGFTAWLAPIFFGRRD
jgi:hypothetical protein